MNENSQYPTRIALGWITMLMLLMITLLTMIVLSALDDDGFSSLRRDPGRAGLGMMSFVVALYAMMPMLTFTIDRLRATALRWVMVAFAGANFFFLMLHHLSHWYGGDRPTLSSHMIDIAIHVIGLWLIYNSVRWARSVSAHRGAQG